VVSGFGVKSEIFGLIPASITATVGTDRLIFSGFLRNRTPATPLSRLEVKAVAERRGGTEVAHNVKPSPGETRTRTPVDGCAIGTRMAADSVTYQVSGLYFLRRPQSSFGETRRLPRSSACESRAAAERPRGRGGGHGGRAQRDRRVWRAGNWEDRRPEAPAGGRERVAVAVRCGPEPALCEPGALRTRKPAIERLYSNGVFRR
jgi:hypothetical protein